MWCSVLLRECIIGGYIMTSAEEHFKSISNLLSHEHVHVSQGKMMSSDGIRYREKFFAFFHRNEMVFKLGRETEPSELGVKDYSILSPFKKRPPMKDWFQIPYSESDKWEMLARRALQRMKSELG
jgi:hypothetical protein